MKIASIQLFTFSHPLSLLIWLLLQLLVLLLPVMQVPLSEQFPRPAEKMAAAEMLVAQIALSALLFPILMPTPSAVLVIAAATWPFLQLAGVLSSAPPYRIIEAGAFISLWIVSLGILVAGESSPRWKMWWVGVGAAISIGGAIAAYLRLEFSSGQRVDGLFFGPIVGALQVLGGSEDRWRAWILIFAFLLVTVAARIARMKLARKVSQQLVHNFCG